MLEVKKLVVGELGTNCYLVTSKLTPETLVIDPGDEAEFIERQISDLSLKPIAVILTHGHFDHLLASLELSLAYAIPIYLNSKDNFLVRATGQTARHFTRARDALQPIKLFNTEGFANLELGSELLKIINLPGHTPGSIGLYAKRDGFIFSGDLIFSDGSRGETNHPYSDKKALNESLEKITLLPTKTIIYPGHGDTFKVVDIKKQKL